MHEFSILILLYYKHLFFIKQALQQNIYGCTHSQFFRCTETLIFFIVPTLLSYSACTYLSFPGYCGGIYVRDRLSDCAGGHGEHGQMVHSVGSNDHVPYRQWASCSLCIFLSLSFLAPSSLATALHSALFRFSYTSFYPSAIVPSCSFSSTLSLLFTFLPSLISSPHIFFILVFIFHLLLRHGKTNQCSACKIVGAYYLFRYSLFYIHCITFSNLHSVLK